MRRIMSTLVLVLIALFTFSAVAFATASAPDSRHMQVSFADGANGYLAGVQPDQTGYIARTADGGATWAASRVSGYSISGLGVASASTAWGVSAFDVSGTYRFGVRTVDFGANWAPTAGVLEGDTDPAEPYDITASSSDTAFIVGKHHGDFPNGNTASIWRTVNGGASWSKVYRGPLYAAANDESEIPQTEAAGVAADRAGSAIYVLVRETDEGSASVKSNYVLRSLDNGSSWTTSSPNPLDLAVYPNSTGANISTLADISAASSDVAWAAGPMTTSLGQVYKTTDGHAWTKTAKNPSFPVNGIDAFDANRAVVVGEDGKVALTVNGGVDWFTWQFTGVNFNNLQSVSFTGSDPNTAVAVGDDQLIVQLTFGMNGATPTATGVVKRSVNGNLTSTTIPVQQATSLALSVPATPAYASATVSGNVTASGAVVPGRSVKIEQSTNGSSWSAAVSVVTDANGGFAWAANPKVKTWYRASFAGDTAYKASSSAVVIAKPKVSLGTPVAPKTMKAKKGYTVYGSLKPKHTSGSKSSVRIYKYKWVSKKWKAYGYVRATNTNYHGYTRYKVKMSLPSKGTWKLVAKAPVDAQHTATTSAKYDKVKVK
ncbi:MAG TPA: hypothetical protein VFG89_04975 [Coriobacteriia bacterium]|nr:hypothetical protein [Coriobacteriia bacterium]